MIYLVETYKQYKGKPAPSLVDIDTFNRFKTPEEAEERIKTLYNEQRQDNDRLLRNHQNSIMRQVMDIDDTETSDRILREPEPYNYTFKWGTYTQEEADQIP